MSMVLLYIGQNYNERTPFFQKKTLRLDSKRIDNQKCSARPVAYLFLHLINGKCNHQVYVLKKITYFSKLNHDQMNDHNTWSFIWKQTEMYYAGERKICIVEIDC